MISCARIVGDYSIMSILELTDEDKKSMKAAGFSPKARAQGFNPS